MSNWKNDRAEASMREFDQKNMAAALEKKKEKENQQWEELAISLRDADEPNADEYINWVVERLREKYELPKLK